MYSGYLTTKTRGMPTQIYKRLFFLYLLACSHAPLIFAQNILKLKYKNSLVYGGLEVGSKGVKLSLLEIGRNAKKSGAFNILKDTSINTDFISFTNAAFSATLNAVYGLYTVAVNKYSVPAARVFTVVSSGVKIQAEKDNKSYWINRLIDSIKTRVNDPNRTVEIIDVAEEARLSHLGIIPDAKRYSTFLIDIGSGNTKGGYFPNGNTKEIKLFQLTWGTKSTANEADKRCEDDKSISNFNKQVARVVNGVIDNEVVYAVNASGAYNMSDNIAFSGGIAWSVATLISPELADNSIVPVTYADVVKFNTKLSDNFSALQETVLVKGIKDSSVDKAMVAGEIKKVMKVFDQKSLIAGTGLMLKIMRQFEGLYEKKQFFLIKSGQVGWISAYVDDSISPQ